MLDNFGDGPCRSCRAKFSMTRWYAINRSAKRFAIGFRVADDFFDSRLHSQLARFSSARSRLSHADVDPMCMLYLFSELAQEIIGRVVDSWKLGLSRTCDVERDCTSTASRNEISHPGDGSGKCVRPVQSNLEKRLRENQFGTFPGEDRSRGQYFNMPRHDQQCGVAIANIPGSALIRIRGRRLFQTRIDCKQTGCVRVILSPTSSGTPADVFDILRPTHVKCCAIDTRLPTRTDYKLRH
jgi:hypothetical protein